MKDQVNQLNFDISLEKPWVERCLTFDAKRCVAFIDIQGDLSYCESVDNPIVEIFRSAEQHIHKISTTTATRSARHLQNHVRRVTGNRKYKAPVREIITCTAGYPTFRRGITHCDFHPSNFDEWEDEKIAQVAAEYFSDIKPIFDNMLSAFCYNSNGYILYAKYLERLKDIDSLLDNLKLVETNADVSLLLALRNAFATEINSCIKQFIKSQGFALPETRLLSLPSDSTIRDILSHTGEIKVTPRQPRDNPSSRVAKTVTTSR